MTYDFKKTIDQSNGLIYKFVLNNKEFTFRPLGNADVENLSMFLKGLSKQTQEFSTFDSYDIKMATKLCDSIDKYDKLRFVITNQTGEIVGLIELSFDIPDSDIKRFVSYGFKLDIKNTIRFGPTLSDKYQGIGLGAKVFEFIKDITKKFNRNTIILWGGVFQKNVNAIKYYQKVGFSKVGDFIKDNQVSVDMVIKLGSKF